MARVLLVLPLLLLACDDGPAGPAPGGSFEPTARCLDGQAGDFTCAGLDLLARVPIPDLELEPDINPRPANDIWGWTDAATGRDYVLVGRSDGVSILDVTDPTDPAPVGRLPSAGGEGTERDVKVYADHAFVVADGAAGGGVQVLDLRRLRDASGYTVFTEDARYDGIVSAHNIAINEETGFAYASGGSHPSSSCGVGLHMIDIRSPASPGFAGCFVQPGTGLENGNTFDAQCVVYDGPDAEHRGREICLTSNQTAVVVVDVTDKGAPSTLAVASYPNWGFIHQGWLTPDQRYFLQADRTDELHGYVEHSRLIVWDLADLDEPALATEYFGPTGAIDHNIYVRGDLAYYANFRYGLRVLDVGNPVQPKELAHFDTHPGSDLIGFDGAWSVYPFFDNGVIAVSSTRDGLFLLQLAD